MDARIEKLWTEKPCLHERAGEGLIHWGMNREQLTWLAETVKPGWRTIETGAGTSTLTLACLGAQVVSIDPAPGLFGRIAEYAAANGIDMDTVRTYENPSGLVLPLLIECKEEGFDLAILDGNHAFPDCFTDFQHMSRLLKGGGLLFVDDVLDLWQCKFLAAWIRAQRPEFVFREQLSRSAIFEKVAVTPVYDFHIQPPFAWDFA
jgi:predicted O-methyltransferase YrrM